MLTDKEKALLLKGLTQELEEIDAQRNELLASIERHSLISPVIDPSIQRMGRPDGKQRNKNVKSRVFEFIERSLKPISAVEIATAIGGKDMPRRKSKARAVFFSAVHVACSNLIEEGRVSRRREQGIYKYSKITEHGTEEERNS